MKTSHKILTSISKFLSIWKFPLFLCLKLRIIAWMLNNLRDRSGLFRALVGVQVMLPADNGVPVGGIIRAMGRGHNPVGVNDWSSTNMGTNLDRNDPWKFPPRGFRPSNDTFWWLLSQGWAGCGEKFWKIWKKTNRK